MNQPKTLRAPSFVSVIEEISVAKVVGSCEIIPAKITSEIPFPTPFSVIISPIHINRTEPVTIAVTATIQFESVIPLKLVEFD